MNTQNAQNAILDQLRAIPHGTKVRFHLRRPDGSLFSHTSAIDLTRVLYPDGFDMTGSEVALATPINPYHASINPWWASWCDKPGRGPGGLQVCAIVGIEPLAPELPDLETLQKWVADGTTVRIDYSPAECTAEFVGPSPVTCKLLQARDGDFGLSVRVPSNGPQGYWCMYLDATKGDIGPCRPLVTSITPVTEAVAQTPEEIDTIMQAAAKSGARVEAIMANGTVRDGVLLYDGSDYMPYRISDTLGADGIWMGPNCQSATFRVVSVRELPAEKQTEAEMLALLQAAERDGNHVEATMCDGSKVTGEVSRLQTCEPYHMIPSGMVRVSIGEQGASFGAKYDSERIAAVKLLPREEKRPVVQTYDPSKVTVTFSSPMARALGIDGPFSLADIPTLRIKVDEKTHITPTCCADVAPYIGRRVRITDTDGNDDTGTIALVGRYWGKDGFEIEEQPDNYWSMEGVTIELLPDEPNLMIEPTCPADLEPYIGRRVRVLAGPERDTSHGREGILTSVDHTWLFVDGDKDWRYAGGQRSTLVEVLPELQDAEPDDCDDDLEDDADDAVSAGSIWEEPVLTLLTLAELLAMAPDPSDGLAYAAYHHTVAAAIAAGLVTA